MDEELIKPEVNEIRFEDDDGSRTVYTHFNPPLKGEACPNHPSFSNDHDFHWHQRIALPIWHIWPKTDSED